MDQGLSPRQPWRRPCRIPHGSHQRPPWREGAPVEPGPAADQRDILGRLCPERKPLFSRGKRRCFPSWQRGDNRGPGNPERFHADREAKQAAAVLFDHGSPPNPDTKAKRGTYSRLSSRRGHRFELWRARFTFSAPTLATGTATPPSAQLAERGPAYEPRDNGSEWVQGTLCVALNMSSETQPVGEEARAPAWTDHRTEAGFVLAGSLTDILKAGCCNRG
ncbi:hypothetical protein AAFF_G00099690 [Aldrovandia affinis]|uniref:Uncharacterized protein n=1 Tax=Aldrovandia affinis TaxID=143900 RepID=A0AAD7WBB8_9TELE|nr:hypothetical protein AAFF_G00099690 [Aldrovandia affinis]